MEQNTSQSLFRRWRSSLATLLLMCGDVLAVFVSLLISLVLRFDIHPLSETWKYYLDHRTISLPISLALYVPIFASFRLYRYAWRFASLETARGVVLGCTVGLVGVILTQHLIDGTTLRPSVLIIFWMVSILCVGGVRVVLRLAHLSQSYGSRAVRILRRDLTPRRVVILSAGASGVRLLSALPEEYKVSYNVVGFLDDNPTKHGTYVRDVRVLGPLSRLYDLLAEDAVDEVFIALPEASGDDIREYAMACRKRKIPVKVIPTVRDVLNHSSTPKIEDISVNDLLRRPPVDIDMSEIGCFLTGRRVLVTGAGGSIGSELCRQILRFKPTTLVLLGHGENSIHRIHEELTALHPNLANRLRMVIASVSDETRINQVFRSYRPEIVFHAAAHKHVPIMEMNVLEAVQNNVLGTTYVAEACGRCGVRHMVVISTDKAVYPSSVMGATKWLCEQVVRSMGTVHRDTTYVTVRFGNVLGSRGSVVPIFHEQIKRGGPVTITHPDMTRYFMSIPEAVQLVLQAGAVGRSGHLYLLDMGNPVKIVDLACDMIRLCGHEPETDISVVFTGIRPGEKLHELLVSDDEELVPAYCEGMSLVRCPDTFTSAEMMEFVRRAQQVVAGADEDEMFGLLGQVVPGFANQHILTRPS